MADPEKKAPSPDSGDAEEGQARTLRSGSVDDIEAFNVLGYKPEMARNRSMFTLLFQSLAIAAIPYGEGGPLISAIYGGGQLSIFLGWIGKAEQNGTARRGQC
ncbi:MAG: hypothetical protein INR71_16200 [Terriglobus roseus]|nr:hypothetical protein [Terriglobus roseus]